MQSAFANGQLDRLFRRVGASHSAVSSDPWLVVIDNLISPDEADELLEVANLFAYQHSKDARYDESYRTSRTVHCGALPRCRTDPSAKRLESRASELLGIPLDHSEPMQVVRYEVGDEYKTHHDQNALRDEPWGVRGLTLFVYLSDAHDEAAGGETLFPLLNLSVTPRRGRALLWSNVLLDSPDASDRRTFHAGAPVLRGVKHGVNLWWHPYPYRPFFFQEGCGKYGHAQYVHPHHPSPGRWSAAENILVWNGTFQGFAST